MHANRVAEVHWQNVWNNTIPGSFQNFFLSFLCLTPTLFSACFFSPWNQLMKFWSYQIRWGFPWFSDTENGWPRVGGGMWLRKVAVKYIYMLRDSWRNNTYTTRKSHCITAILQPYFLILFDGFADLPQIFVLSGTPWYGVVNNLI